MHPIKKSTFTMALVVALTLTALGGTLALASNVTVNHSVVTQTTLPAIAADADTFVREGSTTNFGQRTYMGVDGSTGEIERSYFYFTVSGIPAGATIDSAILQVTTRPGPGLDPDPNSTTDGSLQTMIVGSAPAGWGEDTLTFANQPGCSGSFGTFVPSVPSTLYEINVTAAVPGNGVVGLCIRLQDESSNDGVKLNTGETNVPGTDPKLVITYTEAGVPTEVPTEVPTTVPGETPVPTVAPAATAVPRPGADMIPIPEWATGGKVLQWTHVFYAAVQGAAGVEELAPGTSIWVYGLDSTRQFYLAMLAGKLFWLPVGVVGPNYESPWFGRPLPTQIVDGEGNAL